ncbi:hypothetical protein PENANT_c075G07274 [Penicillium antarcticum]|uniref:Uncharacterized protein n=1 Tax=Penicillium antarcticum TaxID=416450 RepID=A0A1V6PPG2_9EURO|nr:uncharacterized protein N7508_000179 [Penicillium antarcticum]KAJ5319896.1 hypothetical protein N7508_000179 [Penicillium antarcticum]OQD78864.1 hypothetical protein PENANT_c075G07274 [Penicillium antarcticum]
MAAAILILIELAIVSAIPVSNHTRVSHSNSSADGFSGCYPCADPDCGVAGSYCQCAHGEQKILVN